MKEIIFFIIFVIILWIIFAILLPYIRLPNFLFKEKIEKNQTIAKIAKKLKAKTKKQTLENVYAYVRTHFEDYHKEFDLRHLNRFYELFQLHNYKVRKLLILHRKKFMWCYAQVKVLVSLLKNTRQFSEKEIKIKTCFSPYFSIHQYILIKIGNEKIKIDPFYGIYKQIR